MSATLGDVNQAREHVLSTALRVLAEERGLAVDDRAAVKVKDASDALALAARELTTATDLLPRGQQPKGWGAQ